jgi:hypothetical protein
MSNKAAGLLGPSAPMFGVFEQTIHLHPPPRLPDRLKPRVFENARRGCPLSGGHLFVARAARAFDGNIGRPAYLGKITGRSRGALALVSRWRSAHEHKILVTKRFAFTPFRTSWASCRTAFAAVSFAQQNCKAQRRRMKFDFKLSTVDS